jgi:hypothetical protein
VFSFRRHSYKAINIALLTKFTSTELHQVMALTVIHDVGAASSCELRDALNH